MDIEDEVTLWIQQFADDPDSNTNRIWQNYYQKLIHVARRKLRDMPRRHLDEEDVATDAMNSLFKGIQSGRFPDLNDRQGLWKILLTITARKAAKAIRSNMAEKRGGGQIRGESVFAKTDDSSAMGLGNILGPEPTPEFAEDIAKSCEDMLLVLDDDVLKSIALMKLEGYSNDEIATRLDVAVRTVERKLSRIRTIWADNGIAAG